MKNILIASVIFAATVISVAAQTGPIHQGPLLRFENKEIDIGYFDADSVQTARVKIYNRGDADLSIINIFTDCRCTRQQIDKRVIAPGDSTTVTVEYDGSGHAPGKIRRTLRVRSNSTDDAYASFYIKGEIKRPLRK